MKATGTAAAVEVFLSYSHKDEALRSALVEHLAVLQREHLIMVWHDRRIGAGAEWQGQIDAHLLSAGMILPLISPSFIASTYCYDIELQTALERQAKEGVPIVPVLLRPVDWSRTPFARFQALPRNGVAVTEWADQDAAFRDIVSGLRDTLQPAIDAGVISPQGWWRAPVPASWTVVVMATLILTFFSRVFFSIVTPAAPLDAGGTLIVFAFWLGAAAIARYAVYKLRQVSVRRTGRTAPNSRDAGGRP